MDKMATIERYDYVATPRDQQWGLHVAGTGTRVASPHHRYQVHEPSAPFQWGRGRTLPYYGMVYLAEGHGEFVHSDAAQQCVQAGDVLLLFPNVWHNYWPNPEKGWTEFWVLYDGLLPNQWCQQGWFGLQQPVLCPGLRADLLQLFTQLLTTARANPPYANQLLAGLVMQLAATVLRRLHRAVPPVDDANAKLITRARAAIESQWQQPFDMEALSASLGLSYRHFRRLFQQHTGLPPNQFLLNLRVNRAKQLLEESLTIEQVARRCGFADPSYFSRLFKQKTGIAPARWRG